jgi:tyrosyl-tRNA synthetase
MTLYEDLAWRGLISQATHPELGGLREKERLTLYAGFDPMADGPQATGASRGELAK